MEMRGKTGEKVSANQVVGEFSQLISEIEANIRTQREEHGFSHDGSNELVAYMKERSMLLIAGLLPDDDYHALSVIIDKWLGSAQEVTHNATELDTCERAVKRSLDAVQGNMIINKILSDEAKEELARRWPVEETKSA